MVAGRTKRKYLSLCLLWEYYMMRWGQGNGEKQCGAEMHPVVSYPVESVIS